MAKAGWPEAGWTGSPRVAKRAKRAKSQERETFVLRTYTGGGRGVKKLHID